LIVFSDLGDYVALNMRQVRTLSKRSEILEGAVFVRSGTQAYHYSFTATVDSQIVKLNQTGC